MLNATVKFKRLFPGHYSILVNGEEHGTIMDVQNEKGFGALDG